MEIIQFNIEIQAKINVVWEILWNDETYRKWTSVFHPTSHAVGTWEQGEHIQFLTDTGKGMYALIEEKIIPNRMVFKHLGEIQQGNFIPQNWENAYEKYFLSENENGTLLTVELHTLEEFKAFFMDVFPKALTIIKELAEAR